MQQLLLTPVTVQAVRGLVQRGHGLRLSYDTLKLRRRSTTPPIGCGAAWLPGPFRHRVLSSRLSLPSHLSVQGPGKWPGMTEVRKLMKLAGFQASLEGVISWADREPARQAVHVLEPLDGRWEALCNG
jgi:hypothetical protein